MSKTPKAKTPDFDSNINSADASTAVSVRAAQAGKAMKIEDVVISVGVATNVTLQDEDDTAILGPLYMPANSVFAKTFGGALTVPTGKALEVIAGDAGNITVTVTGHDE